MLVAAQTEATLTNLDRVRCSVGATRQRIVETTVLIVGLRGSFATISAAQATSTSRRIPRDHRHGVIALTMSGQLLGMLRPSARHPGVGSARDQSVGTDSPRPTDPVRTSVGSAPSPVPLAGRG
jgi:hypothetical protein